MTTRPYTLRKRLARRGKERERPFYPYHFFRGLMAAMGTIAAISTVSAIFPRALDRIADPLMGPDPGAKILWILKPAILLGDIVFRPSLTVIFIAILATLFVLLPILDRSGQRSIKRRILVAVPFLLWMLFLAWSLLLSTGVRV